MTDEKDNNITNYNLNIISSCYRWHSIYINKNGN